jgi:hypothetical protein
MRADWRAVGRRAWRTTGQATGDRAAMRPARAVSPPHRRLGTCPSDRRRPCWLHFVGLGAACGRRPVFRSSASRACPLAGLRLGRLKRDPLRPGSSPLASLALGRSPCSPELASSEVPGCGSRLVPVPLVARSRPRPLPRSWRQIHRQPSARLRCLGPKTGWRPAGPSARDGAVPAGHLPPVQRRDTRLERGAGRRGEIGEPVPAEGDRGCG